MLMSFTFLSFMYVCLIQDLFKLWQRRAFTSMLFIMPPSILALKVAVWLLF
jgi:hypothetical protein